jgi:hypothetical protein
MEEAEGPLTPSVLVLYLSQSGAPIGRAKTSTSMGHRQHSFNFPSLFHLPLCTECISTNIATEFIS